MATAAKVTEKMAVKWNGKITEKVIPFKYHNSPT